MDAYRDKLLSDPDLLPWRRRQQDAGRRLVFTNGCFDLIHRAHVEYLREVRQLGDILLVGVNSDASVRALKGAGRPLQPLADRLVTLAEMHAVDRLCVFEAVSVAALVQRLLPDVLAKGGDYEVDGIVGGDAVRAAGGRVCAVSLWPGLSTSALVDRIRQLPT